MAVAERVIGECGGKTPHDVEMVVTFAAGGHDTHNTVFVVISTNGMEKAIRYTPFHYHIGRKGQVFQHKNVVARNWRGIYCLIGLVEALRPKDEAHCCGTGAKISHTFLCFSFSAKGSPGE